MNTTSNKIIGWILLAIGLAMISWSIYSSHFIFTGKKEAPKIFFYAALKNDNTISSLKEEKAAPGDKNIRIDEYKSPSELSANLQQDQMDQIKSLLSEQIGKQLSSIMPPEFFAKIMDLTSWSIFVFIMISAGGKISSLGIRLLKN